MKISIDCLVTTFGLTLDQIYTMLSNMNLFTRTIVRNQNSDIGIIETTINKQDVLIVGASDIGLSKNRNEVLKLSKADYVMFCDDDICFADNIEEIIVSEFQNINDSNLCSIVFNITSLNKNRQIALFTKKTKKLKFKYVRGSGVWRFLIKREKITDIRFDETIGSGTKYLCGEDTIFMYKFINSFPYNSYICNKIIGTISHNKSIWFSKRNTDEYLIAKGHVYKTIYPYLYPLYIIRFLIKEKKFTFSNINKTFKGATKWEQITKTN